jgi:hypothetical protein
MSQYLADKIQPYLKRVRELQNQQRDPEGIVRHDLILPTSRK